jgi:hypothetical protein
MPDYKYYIPREDAKYDEYAENFNNQLPPIATAIGGIPADLVTAVTDGYADWDVAFDAQTVAQNAALAATQVKDEARVTLSTAIRLVGQLLQKHPALTDAQRQTLGLTVPDLIKTPTSPDYVVSLAPPLLLLEPRRGLVIVHFGVNPSNEKLNAKPDAIAGANIWYRVESGPWAFVALDTNSPYNHNFAITEPQNVEYRAQWVDKKGRSGIFSETAKCAVTP